MNSCLPQFLSSFSEYRGWLIVVTKPDRKQRQYVYTAYRQSLGPGLTRFSGSTNLSVLEAQNMAAEYIDELYEKAAERKQPADKNGEKRKRNAPRSSPSQQV